MSTSCQEIAFIGNKKEHPARGALISKPALILGQSQQSKDALLELQKERDPTAGLLISLPFRLQSISHKSAIDWLEWIAVSPGSYQDLIDRIEAGDAYLEAVVLEVRTEVGL